METADESDLEARLTEIETRARRSWRFFLPAFVVVCAAFGIGFGVINGSHHSHRHHSLAGALIGFGAAALVVLVVLLVAARARRSGRWAPPLSMGLPFRQRRQIGRDLRRGTPNADPVLREVELRMARRLTRQYRRARWAYPLIIAVEVGNAVFPDRGTFSRIFFVALAVAFTASWPYQRRLQRRLANFGDDTGRDSPAG